MARVDLGLDQLTRLCRLLEEHTGQLDDVRDYTEVLALSHIYVVLLKACRAELIAMEP